MDNYQTFKGITMAKENGVGIVVGRFQVNRLHEGHTILLNRANNHKKLAVFLGSPRILTQESPLDFQTRKAMIQELYPEAVVIQITDRKSDIEWCHELDRLIEEYFPYDDVTMYCGRDGFSKVYRGPRGSGPGKNFVKIIDTVDNISGTDIRMDVGQTVIGSEDFRRGVIYGSRNQYPRISPTVDIAVLKKSDPNLEPNQKSNILVLMAKRPGEDKWRFPGGFVSIHDESYERAAKRELREETGLNIEGSLEYVTSLLVDDYRNTNSHKVFTSLFKGWYSWGMATPQDDLLGGQLTWLGIDNLKNAIDQITIQNIIVKEHIPLVKSLCNTIEENVNVAS